jgi:hypothetical protein
MPHEGSSFGSGEGALAGWEGDLGYDGSVSVRETAPVLADGRLDGHRIPTRPSSSAQTALPRSRAVTGLVRDGDDPEWAA